MPRPTAEGLPSGGRMGRPRKDQDGRTELVGVKFTPAEKAHLLALVERHGLASLSDLVRQAALKGRVEIYQRAELSGPDRASLQRLGVNLNQIARHLNERGGELPAIAGVERELRDVLHTLNAVLLAEGRG